VFNRDEMINILAYDEDTMIVLIAPSWTALQCLLDMLNNSANDTEMLCYYVASAVG